MDSDWMDRDVAIAEWAKLTSDQQMWVSLTAQMEGHYNKERVLNEHQIPTHAQCTAANGPGLTKKQKRRRNK